MYGSGCEEATATRRKIFNMKTKLNHIRALDGARGAAVIAVMLYHFMHVPLVSNSKFDQVFGEVLRLGWIGVDLFFVLSGFLITRILLQAKQRQKFSGYLKTFYEKRVLRIFPLYYLYLIFMFFVFFPLIIHHLDGIEKTRLILANRDQLWFWTYLSNIKQVMNGTFYGASVGHLWSLSIEEQFYLFWPFVVYFFPIENIKKITIALLIFTPLLRIFLWQKGVSPISIYVFTFTRMDALAMGSFIAVLATQNVTINYKSVILFFLILLVLSLSSIFYFDVRPDVNAFVYTIGYSLLALCFGSFIFLLQSDYVGTMRTFFNSKFLVFMGKYSYALYLFHPLVRNGMLRLLGTPKLIGGNQLLWNLAFIVFCGVVSVVVALASWNLFEKWFLKLKNKIKIESPKQVLST